MSKLFAMIALSATLLVGPAIANSCGSSAYAAGYSCCKVCHAGKACGDSCISRDKICHKGEGCACNG